MNTNVAKELREIAKRESKYGKLIPSHLIELARQLDDDLHQRDTEDHIQDKEMDDLRAEVRELRAALERARALVSKWRNYTNDPIPLVHRRMADELAAALGDGAR